MFDLDTPNYEHSLFVLEAWFHFAAGQRGEELGVLVVAAVAFLSADGLLSNQLFC